MFQTLISATELADRLQAGPGRQGPGIRILDCRGRLNDPDFGPAAYAAGHIPGAHHGDLDRDFAAPPGTGGRHPLPDPQTLAATLRGWGVNDEDQVVVYDDAQGAFAGRAWWCLRWLGHEATALLDGGLAAWTGPLSREVPAPEPGNFSIRPSLTRTTDAATLVAGLGKNRLIDARTRERFDGEVEPIDPVAGHIPGAQCLPFQDNLEPDGRFKPPHVLRARFTADTTHVQGEVVCYCGSGVTAAHNVLAMRIAGLPEPILYPGSWSEWIVDPARPRAP